MKCKSDYQFAIKYETSVPLITRLFSVNKFTLRREEARANYNSSCEILKSDVGSSVTLSEDYQGVASSAKPLILFAGFKCHAKILICTHERSDPYFVLFILLDDNLYS